MAAASEAIVVLDEAGLVALMTPQAEALWGYVASDLQGRAFPGLREVPGGPVEPQGDRAFVGVRRDGTEFEAEVRLSPVPTSDGFYVALAVREVAAGAGAGTRAAATAGPRRSAAAAYAAQAATVAGPAAGRGRVLIVDDEAVVAKTLGRLLGEEYACTVALGGREAIARITDGERYDAILCDLSMPDAGGEEVHRALSAIDPDQARRIVFVTGGAFTAASHAFLARVANARIDKPFDTRVIRSLVRALVGESA
jgi:CheY-like chemotaxis protein